jgi:hypothetical protein
MNHVTRKGNAIMKELNNELEIHASAEQVWGILTDFASFPEWNPFIHRLSGQAQAGNRLDMRIQPSGARSVTSRPTVLKAEPNSELRWREQFIVPGMLDVEHVFIIEPLGTNHVRFTQREISTGLLVSLRPQRHNTDVRRGFREMNKALKLRAEQRQAADGTVAQM